MRKKYLAITAVITAGIILTGCSTTPPGDSNGYATSSSTASPDQTITSEEVTSGLYPGGMPKVIEPEAITNLTVQKDVEGSLGREVYAWAASFIQISFNDTTLQQMETFRQYGLLSFAPYFTPAALEIAEAHFAQYDEAGDYQSLDKAMQYIGNRGLFTVLPNIGYKYLNSPVFDQFKYGPATLEYAGINSGLDTYKVTVPVSARLVFEDQADKKTYETTFKREFELWIVDSGMETEVRFRIDSWNENPLGWTAQEVN